MIRVIQDDRSPHSSFCQTQDKIKKKKRSKVFSLDILKVKVMPSVGAKYDFLVIQEMQS